MSAQFSIIDITGDIVEPAPHGTHMVYGKVTDATADKLKAISDITPPLPETKGDENIFLVFRKDQDGSTGLHFEITSYTRAQLLMMNASVHGLLRLTNNGVSTIDEFVELIIDTYFGEPLLNTHYLSKEQASEYLKRCLEADSDTLFVAFRIRDVRSISVSNIFELNTGCDYDLTIDDLTFNTETPNTLGYILGE